MSNYITHKYFLQILEQKVSDMASSATVATDHQDKEEDSMQPLDLDVSYTLARAGVGLVINYD